MIFGPNDFASNLSKVQFDRLSDIVKTTYIKRQQTIKVLQIEIQELLDRLAIYKESEKAYYEKWKILQDLMTQSGELVDGTIARSTIETLPDYAKEDRGVAPAKLKNIDAITDEAKSVGVEPATNFNIPEITLASEGMRKKILPIMRKILFWEHKVKYVKLLVERKKIEILKLQQEQANITEGS